MRLPAAFENGNDKALSGLWVRREECKKPPAREAGVDKKHDDEPRKR